MMDHLEHVNLETFVTNYGGTAILGFICSLLVAGKFFHSFLGRKGLVFGYIVIPPAMMSGVLGMWYLCVYIVFIICLNMYIVCMLYLLLCVYTVCIYMMFRQLYKLYIVREI